jgi:hypothetical protein
LPRFAKHDRAALLDISRRTAELNADIETQAINYLHLQSARDDLDRYGFIMLPHAVAREIMGEWLLMNTSVELSRKMLERLVQAAKIGRSGTRVDIDGQFWLQIGRTKLALKLRER